MRGKRREPEALRRGKRFHKLVQQEWLATADGKPHPERTVRQVSGRKGRVDILVDEIGEGLVSVVEIKATDWDRMKTKNIRRNVRRQVRQIWRYVGSQLELRGLSVCPGIIFPKLPVDPARVELIEAMFEEEGIQVVWHDESIEDLRERKRQEAS